MGRLKGIAVECKYKEIERRLRQEWINVITDKTILEEIIRELTVLKYMNKVTLQQYHRDYSMSYIKIHHYKIDMIYKSVPDLYIGDWLSRQRHTLNRNKKQRNS